MEEHFHTSKTLGKDQLKMLMQKNDNPAILHFVVMYVLFLGTGVCVVLFWSGSIWQILLSQFAFGIMCCSTFACEHETVHNTAFKSKQLNQIAARLVGIAHIYACTAFRELHFTHHRYTHQPGMDPEISFANKPLPSVIRNIPSYLAWISGLPLLIFKVLMLLWGALGMPEFIRKIFFSFIRPEVRLKLAIESWYILLIYGTIVFLASYVHAGFWGLLVGQVIGHCILTTYLTSEHNGLPHEGDIFKKTRSMKTNKFVKVLMWNMPYHAEHHAYPAIPFHALPKLHELIKDEITHKDESYRDFHIKVIKREIH